MLLLEQIKTLPKGQMIKVGHFRIVNTEHFSFWLRIKKGSPYITGLEAKIIYGCFKLVELLLRSNPLLPDPTPRNISDCLKRQLYQMIGKERLNSICEITVHRISGGGYKSSLI